MDLILNGVPQSIDASDCANLAELVVAAERLDSDGGQVVTGVEVDGERLTPEELGTLENRSLDGVAKIEIERRPTLEVARSVLLQGADYAGRIVAAIGETVGHYRSGRSDLANELLADVTDSLTVLTGITYSVSAVLVEESKALAKLQGEIFPWLEEMIQAQTDEDPLRIGDLLEYEIAPRILAWGEMMRGFDGEASVAVGLDGEGVSN